MSVCLSVCMWEKKDIDIKNFTRSQLNHTGCNWTIQSDSGGCLPELGLLVF